MKDDLGFMQLWDTYSPLLTKTQQEITHLYFNCDLSLGEIAEQKGVSRQSVSDCLRTCRKQLQGYEQKLGFEKLLKKELQGSQAYKQAVESWMDSQKGGKFESAADSLAQALAKSE